MDNTKFENIKVDKFNIIHALTDPQRIEAKLEFFREDISQKLIFSIMDITHAHGFGCSKPKFGGIDDTKICFYVGTVLPSPRSLKKYVEKMKDCLLDLYDFSCDLLRQLDFSNIDMSMFDGVDVGDVEKIASLRDQYYEGSWDKLKEAFFEYESTDEIIETLIKFEKANGKDLGLIGHKVNLLLDTIELDKNKKLVVLN
jgi:hypothetical protein